MASIETMTNCFPSSKHVIRNHPEYWFEDGSLVLDVQVTRFKVHQTLLSRHSKFFSAVLKLRGHDSHSNSMLNGCHHVILEREQQIRADDVEALLQHLYHDVPFGNASPFSRVASILRVSSPRQLDFPDLHATAREIAQGMFPDIPTAFTHDHALPDALALAMDFGLINVRKAVLYSLVTTTDFDVTDKMKGTLDPQKTNSSRSPGIEPTSEVQLDSILDAPLLVDGNSQQTDAVLGNAGSTPVVVLSLEDYQICMTLMSRIIEYFTPILFTPATSSHMDCTNFLAESWMSFVIQPAINDSEVYKPLESLDRIKNIDWVKHGLCESCAGKKREEWTNEQRTLWTLIDSWLEASKHAIEFAEDT